MNFRPFISAIFIILVLQSCRQSQPAESQQPAPADADLVISNINVIDVRSGKVSGGKDVYITGDSIGGITDHGKTNIPQVQTIDGSGKFLIPGLWDMHTHSWLSYKEYSPLLLANGVVGVRDMFGELDRVKELKDSLHRGLLSGPRIISSGQIIDGRPATWRGSVEVTNSEAGRALVRKQLAEGADFIKVYSMLNKDVYQAIAGECKKLNVSMSGHIPFKVKLEEAVGAGQQSAEHFFGVLEYCAADRDAYYSSIQDKEYKGFWDGYTDRLKMITDSFDSSRVAPMIELLRNNNMWMSPTCVVNRAAANITDSLFVKDERVAYMPENVVTMWRQWSRLPPEYYEAERKWYLLGLTIMKRMVDGNVKFLAATDYGNPYVFPGFSLHDEMSILVRDAHFSPLQALQTATLNPSIFLRTNSGVIESGKTADLLVLNGNPLEDISNTRSIDGLVMQGKYFTGDDLKTGMEKLRRH